jgi:hypothetical protein
VRGLVFFDPKVGFSFRQNLGLKGEVLLAVEQIVAILKQAELGIPIVLRQAFLIHDHEAKAERQSTELRRVTTKTKQVLWSATLSSEPVMSEQYFQPQLNFSTSTPGCCD